MLHIMDLRRRNLLTAAAIGLLARRTTAQQQAPVAARQPGPAVTLNVRDFGALADGNTKDTASFQQALDRCSVLGGGEVMAPAGNYLIGAIALRSNTYLRLEPGATLTGSPDFADYPVTQVRWEGKWIQGRSALIYAIDANNTGVVGAGHITGNPALGGRPNAQNPLRHPALIELIGCKDVRLEDFSAEYRLMWSVHPTYCENVTIRNLTIRSTGGNGDGIDVDSCKHVRIEGCDISTGDDCIAIKSGRGSEAYVLRRTTEDVLISNCTFADSIFACIGIGSETSGGIRGVRIEHCTFTHAATFAIYIKSRPGRGAFIEDITATDLDVSDAKGGFLRINLLNSGLQDEFPVAGDEGIPSSKNLRFSDIRVKDCGKLADVTGLHPSKPLDGFTLSGVKGACAAGIEIANAKNVEIRDINVSVTGPLIGSYQASGRGLESAVAIPAPKLPEPVAPPAVPYRPK
jgi:polygalacturonase